MTSTLLTVSRFMAETRRARCWPWPFVVRDRNLAFLAAIPRRDAFFLGVLRRRLLDHRAHDRLVGLGPVSDDVPLRSVPLHELDRAAAFVVHARDLERLHESGRPELLDAGIVDVQMLQAPADLVASHRLALAELALRGADSLGGDDAE